MFRGSLFCHQHPGDENAKVQKEQIKITKKSLASRKVLSVCLENNTVALHRARLGLEFCARPFLRSVTRVVTIFAFSAPEHLQCGVNSAKLVQSQPLN